MPLRPHPRETVDFEAFTELPGPAVALDGYVPGPTRYGSRHVSFNHHEGVDRFCTRATCEQVALAIRSRCELLVAGPEVDIHLNDPDPDVAVSAWLLKNPNRVREPHVTHLVTLEGAIDTTGGCCAEPEDIDELAWVIAPWAERRDEMATLGAEDMGGIVEEICWRIDAYADGRGQREDASDSYDVLARDGGLWAVIEHHPLARARLCADGAAAFVALRPGGEDPSAITVTLGKASPFVELDLEACYTELNAREGCQGLDRWGGSDLVGGSPRAAGTRLNLDEILEVTGRHLRRR